MPRREKRGHFMGRNEQGRGGFGVGAPGHGDVGSEFLGLGIGSQPLAYFMRACKEFSLVSDGNVAHVLPKEPGHSPNGKSLASRENSLSKFAREVRGGARRNLSHKMQG